MIGSKKDWRVHRRNLIINHEVSEFTKTFRNNFITLIMSAFGVVAALSWNDAIRSWIDVMFPEKTVLYKFYSAVIVTFLTITLTYFISKLKK